MEGHFRKLERMYLSAPINDWYEPSIKVEKGRAEIIVEIAPKFYHAAHAVHGSVYFKMLDDAAIFAAASLVEGVFMLTRSFEIQLLKPVTEGELWVVGEVTEQSDKVIRAKAILYDKDEVEIASGSGNFMKGKIVLSEEIGYK